MHNEKELYKKVFKVIKKKSGLHEPSFDNLDIKEITKCVKSSFVSTYGEYVVKFESLLKKYTKAKYVIATNTGSAALHIALKVAGVKKNTNVLLPTLSFVATGNCVIYNNANPIFLDSSENSFCLDEKKLENYIKNETVLFKKKRYAKYNNKVISAIIVTHVFGNSSDIQKITDIGKKYSIPIVEDCAEGLGSFYKTQHLGTYGELGVLSFNGNKIITAGSGGAIMTNSKKKYLEALHLVSVAKIKHKWSFIHDRVGWNYRINSLSASLGYSQLKKINKILHKKKFLHKKYKDIFKNNKNFEIVDLDNIKNLKSNYWLNAMKINTNNISKSKVLDYLNEKGIQCRPIWDLLHTLPHFLKYKSYKIEKSKKLFDSVILLPSSPKIIK
jgi:perosamine synthetase